MKRIILIIILLSLSGCSLISVQSGGSKPKKIPAQPTISRELEEVLSQEADLNRRMAGQIYAIGAPPKAPESKMLLDTSDKILTYTGKPSKPVKQENIKELHKRFEKAISKQRQREHEWENEILSLREERADLAAENGKLKVSFANLKAWFWILVIALIAIMVIFPSTIPLIVGWAKSAGKALAKLTKRQFRETIAAVQKIRKDENIPEDIRELIDNHLSAAQSADTRIEIAKVKKENHF